MAAKKNTALAAKSEPYVEVAKDSQNQWHWQLWAGNGSPMARNAVAYTDRKQCIAAVAAIEDLMRQARSVVTATRD